jgi:hypothetical protein
VKATTWILGILAGIVLLATVVAFIPQAKDAWFKIFPRPEYKYITTNGSSFNFTEVQRLKDTGWVVDDVLYDSCGNIGFSMRKDR